MFNICLFSCLFLGWPCLSFDTVVDNLGDNRSEFPFTCSLVAGTQAERSRDNEIIAMRLSNLTAVECLFLSYIFFYFYFFTSLTKLLTNKTV